MLYYTHKVNQVTNKGVFEMRSVNVSVYEFDDLPKDVQGKVIDRYRDNLAYLLNEDLEDIMNRELNNYVDNLDFELRYSLNCCQGDGVSFDGIAEGKEKLLTLASLVYDNKIPKNVLRLIKWGIIYGVDFTRYSHHYVHKYTVKTNIITDYIMVKDCHTSRAMTEFENAINEWYLQVCDNLEKIGYDTIEILYGDDNIKCYIDENSLEFYEDGDDYK